jgi:O-acetyl-ADP-ribose deacetylase (regulator of RNase III)
MEIKYIKGDATEPIIHEGKYSVICHCCNAIGAWGKGFVVPLGKKYPRAKERYFEFIKASNKDNRLGSVSFAKVADNVIVANIIGQYDIYPKNGKIPLDYEALEKGFKFIIEMFEMHRMPLTIHMPKIGCGLAGGDWNRVENIIKNTFISSNIEVYVYLL